MCLVLLMYNISPVGLHMGNEKKYHVKVNELFYIKGWNIHICIGIARILGN